MKNSTPLAWCTPPPPLPHALPQEIHPWSLFYNLVVQYYNRRNPTQIYLKLDSSISPKLFCFAKGVRVNNNNILSNEANIHYRFPSSFHYGPPKAKGGANSSSKLFFDLAISYRPYQQLVQGRRKDERARGGQLFNKGHFFNKYIFITYTFV